MGGIGGEEMSKWERMSDNGGGGGREKIMVSVRLRPLSVKETTNSDSCEWECVNDTTILFKSSTPERSLLPTSYTFDRVFNCDSTTRRVYEEGAKEVTLSVVSGINSSIFAYGQTSSGKTYTMSGITEYSMADIYDYIEKHEERTFVMKFSAMEIYNEAVKDLLSSDHTPLRLLDDHERGTVVDKLTEETVRDWSHLKELLSVCEAQRQIGETSLNETSSRSHQIIRLTIESCAREFLGKEDASTLSATVNFVDLAGSERASQTMSAGARLKEGCHINRSLLTLGTVIRKLSKGGSGHIPYRDSKLTRILQHSLGGNARTAIICTMSPAKSYVEQTRNTLLFASCAKEVSTSAQVNVVMSDKALVKHLQKELSRLEVELKSTKSPSNISQADALLMEKENHIRKLEEKIHEFMHQRDLAQSRLQDVLRSTGNNQILTHPDISKPPRSRISKGQSQPISPTTYHGPEYDGVTNLNTSSDFASESDISSNQDLQILRKQTDEEAPSARFPSISCQYFDELLQQHGGEDITMVNSNEFGDLWKEVRCIEIDEISTNKNLQVCDPNPIVKEDQKIQNANEVGDNLMKQNKYEPQQSPDQLSQVSCNSSSISRSTSFRSSVTRDSSSRWYSDNEHIATTPIRRLFKDFPGQLPYESQSSRPEAITGPKMSMTAPEDDIASLCEFVVGLREIARVKYQKQHVGGQTQKAERKVSVDTTILIPPKNTSAELMANHVESPLQWPLEFEKRQRRIIVLWHECNVSLVHRTYFFLLFKGDPSDSFYMEVELRRLSFLKRVFTLGDAYKPVMEDGCIVTPASSKKALRREREMLSKKMLKKLSSGERKTIYLKWGIPLDSKKRRLQLAELLWSDTRNMTSIRESASIVANLIGLLEPGQALKEMFGLSFTPQKMSRRSSWKHAMPSPIRSAYSC